MFIFFLNLFVSTIFRNFSFRNLFFLHFSQLFLANSVQFRIQAYLVLCSSTARHVSLIFQMDASGLHARMLNAKEVLTPMKGGNFIFLVADGTVKISGGGQDLRPSTSVRDRPIRGEEQGNLGGESDGSSSTPLRDSSWYDREAGTDFWSISSSFIYRHHVEPRVKLYVPTAKSFLIH